VLGDQAPLAVDGYRGAGVQSPDGRRVLLGPIVLDAHGVRLTGPTDSGTDTLYKWAGDSRTLCGMRALGAFPAKPSNEGQPMQLVTAAPGYVPGPGAEKTTGRFGSQSAQAGVDVVACNPATDRATLVQRGPIAALELWVVKPSTGAILAHRALSRTSDVVGSPDAVYVAENPAPVEIGSPPSDAPAVVRFAVGGAPVASLRDTLVLAFSARSNRMLLTRAGTIQVTDLHGRAIWTNDLPEGFGQALARAGSDDLAVAFIPAAEPSPPGCGSAQSPCQQTYPTTRDIVIVRPDGSFTSIIGRYRPVW
jgi:hypothetical protein